MALALGFGCEQRPANTFPVASVTYPREAHGPTPQQLAAGLRQSGLRRCAMGYLSECGDRLDAAKELDPKGEDRPEVKEARQRIHEAAEKGHATPHDGLYSKPLLGPGERPQQPH